MFVKKWNAKATHIFFSKNISIYAIFNDQSFNDMLTNGIISFEQLGPNFQAKQGSKGYTAKRNNLDMGK